MVILRPLVLIVSYCLAAGSISGTIHHEEQNLSEKKKRGLNTNLILCGITRIVRYEHTQRSIYNYKYKIT